MGEVIDLVGFRERRERLVEDLERAAFAEPPLRVPRPAVGIPMRAGVQWGAEEQRNGQFAIRIVNTTIPGVEVVALEPRPSCRGCASLGHPCWIHSGKQEGYALLRRPGREPKIVGTFTFHGGSYLGVDAEQFWADA